MKAFDAIVVGVGGAGSAALYHLARRGATALGLDRFPPGHEHGSSHGQTRIIRLAYFEHPDYVPLLLRAYELWAELGEARGRPLYHETGLVEIGPPGGEVVPGVLETARIHQLSVEELSGREVERRFPGLRVPDGLVAAFERRAGVLEVEACVRVHAELAERAGARIHAGETVLDWAAEPQGVRVRTDRETYSARCLVLTPGAWAASLLGNLGIRFDVLRKSLFWYEAPSPAHSAAGGLPAFLFELEHGVFYGTPRIGPEGIKVAEHSGGRRVEDPQRFDREIDPTERARIEEFLQACLPGVTSRLVRHATCLYPMSPDTHFLVDRDPRDPRVCFAVGLSGHGFKFTSVLGEALADLALSGRTDLPIGFLGLDRPGLLLEERPGAPID